MKVSLENVTKRYGSTVAVRDFSALLPDGHLICLLGPSGCGKSTLLNMLCGIVDVTSGRIYFDDKDVTNVPPDRRGIGMVFQNYALYPHMTVQENIAFPLEVQKVPRKERLRRAAEIAALTHVDTLLDRYPGQLSGGQQQRVAIARALIKNPKLLLMDEPLSNLDARLRLEMREEIRRIQLQTGVTTVFVTHDQEEAMSIADSILLMKDGALVQSSECQQLYENPQGRFVADFLGNPPINVIEGGELKKSSEESFSYVLNDGLEIPLPKKVNEKILALGSESVLSRKTVLSVRPESFFYGAGSQNEAKKNCAGHFTARIDRISLLGKEQIVYVQAGALMLRTILDGQQEYSAGQELELCLREKGVFLFDAQSGERVV